MFPRVLAFLLLFTWETGAALKLGAVREIGGSNVDSVAAMVRDAAGNLYITGKTYSVDFPATTGQTHPGGSTLWRVDGAGAQLTPLFGHRGVSVHAVAASGPTLYVFTGDALMKSIDKGTTFTPCDPTLPKEQNLGTIAIDGETVYMALPSIGIFKSTDGCRTFRASFQGIASNAPNQPYPDQIVIDPSRRSTLFASTHYLLFRSDDAGATWQRQTQLAHDLAFDPAHPGVVYGSALDGNYRSPDHGTTWAKLPRLVPGSEIDATLHVDLQGNLYGSNGFDFFSSSDTGATWIKRQTFGGTRAFAVDPDSGTLYVVVGDGIFASSDGFVTTQTVEYYQMGPIYTLAAAHGALFTGNLTPTSDAFVAKLDPTGNTIWLSYLGGAYDDYATCIAVAPNGDVVVGGFQVAGGSMLSRFTGDGALLYSKRWTDPNTIPYGIATDSSGNAYLTGRTTTPYIGSFSGTLPVTRGAAQTTIIPSSGHAPEPQIGLPIPQPYDAFACKFNRDGEIVYCTYLGEGFQNGSTISVDADGNAFVGGGTRVWKVNPDGSAIVYTQTLLGGLITTGTLDGRGSWWIGGSTSVSDFPTTPGAFQRVMNARASLNSAGDTGGDGIIIRLDAATGDIVASTFLGGEGTELVQAIAIGPDGNVTVAGRTTSRTFPLHHAFQASFAQYSGFVSQLTPDLSTLVFSTYAGDTRNFAAFGVALADDGSIWVAGDTAYPWTVGPFGGGAAAIAEIFITQLIPAPSTAPDLITVLNSASLQGTSIAPNETITVIAPDARPDATVLVNGAPLPTLSSNGGVIVAQVPADFQVPSAVNVTVQSGAAISSPLLMRGEIAAPAIYTQDGTGTGLGLIFNEDGSLNSTANPATQGSVVSIAANGLIADSQLHVYIDGALAPVLDATTQPLPGLPGAAVILHVRVPAGTPMPPLVSVMLNVGGVINLSGIQSSPYVGIAVARAPGLP